jgi:hypothetical protein
MPTRIFFSNGEAVTVSDPPDEVATALAGAGFAKLDRPWGDTSIYVNPSEILYIEAQDERAPDIDALEAASTQAPASVPPPQPPGSVPPPQAPGPPGTPA